MYLCSAAIVVCLKSHDLLLLQILMVFFRDEETLVTQSTDEQPIYPVNG